MPISGPVSSRYKIHNYQLFNICRILNQTQKCIEEIGLFYGEKVVEFSEKFMEEEFLLKTVDPYKSKLAKEVKSKIKAILERIKPRIEAEITGSSNTNCLNF